MDEMEIMRKFEKKFQNVEGKLHCKLVDVSIWLPDAVRREIVRVLREAKYNCASMSDGINSVEPDAQAVLDGMIAKYSPVPRYCEGMQEAMEKEAVILGHNGKYYLRAKIKFALERELNRCPFCKEGHNCLKDNHVKA